MSPRIERLSVAMGIGLLGFVAGCPEVNVVPPPAAFTNANAARGGALYDKFWNVAGLDAPVDDHPLWASRPDMDSNTRTGADTWRCKECHGWDYKGVDGAYGSGSHRTGIAGIFGTTATAQAVFDRIKTDHAYGDTGLSDGDIWDLAKFVLEGQIDTDDILDGAAFSGSAIAGKAPYDSACAACHGADGLAPPPGHPEFDEYPGLIADENPWEFQHKVRFGQPGAAMPAQFGLLNTGQVADLGTYVQTLATSPAPVGPSTANAKRGGALYDKFWKVAGLDAPVDDHPLWASRPDTATNTRTGADTWRCKECHGWDYKGVDGAYSSGSHRTGIAGIFGTTLSSQEVVDLITTDHGYAQAGLSDDDILDLAEFVLEGQFDIDDILDANDAFTGSATAGQTVFDTTCAACHGADGLSVPPGGDADFDAFVGFLSHDNPEEFQHKIRFGQPGTGMPAQFDTLDLDGVADLATYSQTLPTEVSAGGDATAGAAFYTTNGCNICHGNDATGVVGPSLVGETAADVLPQLDGTNTHTGGTFAGVTQQDADDLAAWFGSL